MYEIDLAMSQDLENLKLPDPVLLTEYHETARRVIWIDFEIIEDNLLYITKKILNWNYEDIGISKDKRIPIRLLIFSPGGDLQVSNALIDVMLMSETPIYTYSMGESSSAALLILLAGHKRYCLPSSTSVLHKGYGTFSGSASSVNASADWYKLQQKKMREYILGRTTLDTRTYNKRQDEDWYMDSELLIKYGFVDEIIENLSEIVGSEHA